MEEEKLKTYYRSDYQLLAYLCLAGIIMFLGALVYMLVTDMDLIFDLYPEDLLSWSWEEIQVYTFVQILFLPSLIALHLGYYTLTRDINPIIARAGLYGSFAFISAYLARLLCIMVSMPDYSLLFYYLSGFGLFVAFLFTGMTLSLNFQPLSRKQLTGLLMLLSSVVLLVATWWQRSPIYFLVFLPMMIIIPVHLFREPEIDLDNLSHLIREKNDYDYA